MAAGQCLAAFACWSRTVGRSPARPSSPAAPPPAPPRRADNLDAVHALFQGPLNRQLRGDGGDGLAEEDDCAKARQCAAEKSDDHRSSFRANPAADLHGMLPYGPAPALPSEAPALAG